MRGSGVIYRRTRNDSEKMDSNIKDTFCWMDGEDNGDEMDGHN